MGELSGAIGYRKGTICLHDEGSANDIEKMLVCFKMLDKQISKTLQFLHKAFILKI